MGRNIHVIIRSYAWVLHDLMLYFANKFCCSGAAPRNPDSSNNDIIRGDIKVAKSKNISKTVRKYVITA